MTPNQEKQACQPRKGLPWALTIGPKRPTNHFSWTDIRQALEAMHPDGDSFVILEQTDAEGYWFLQSALALMGPHAGEYIVECGYPLEEGAALLERVVPRLEQVIPYFERVYQGESMDLSGFEDKSDWLPGNSNK